MKKEIRLLGIDDSPFNFHNDNTRVIGVVMRGSSYLECVLSRNISIDGSDATFACIDMIKKTRYSKQLKAILLDGITLGGFNVVDMREIHSHTNLPLITITRDKPNFKKIEIALKKNFYDWKKRLKIIRNGELHKITTKHNPIYVKFLGLYLEEVKEIIRISTIRGVIPEPIRVAHIIASGIARGESYGKT
jgi:endonuclease V-like protein UPF0215 family